MYKVMVNGEEKFLVQLVGARSYRIAGMHVRRGGTLSVSKRTRDYLVRQTGGQFVDFDPAPAEPVDEILPPQFGEERGPLFDPADFDPATNPPMTQAEAIRLATQGGSVDQNGEYVEGARKVGAIPVVDNAERGDMTSADLPKGTVKGGATAAKKGGVKVTGAVPGAGADTEAKQAAATTIA